MAAFLKSIHKVYNQIKNDKQKITIDDSQQGQSYAVAGGSYRIVVSGEQTNGNYAVIDMLVPPGNGPGPHAHKDMQELFFVVDGEVEFKTEEGKTIATKGMLVNIPLGGAVHCFKNTSNKTAHLLCTVIPAGLDDFFKQIGQPVEAGIFMEPSITTPEQLQKIKQLAEEFGQQIYPPDFLG